MTARKRSSRQNFGDAVGEAATARSKKHTVTSADLPVGAPRKYTVLLDDTTADAFDVRLLAIRRQVGRRVDKSEVVRELLALLDDDPTVTDQVVERLRLR